MSAVQLFDFKAHQIRVVEINGAPWFVAADVCKTLDLDNPSYVTKRLGNDEKASFKLPNQRGSAATVISESGLYKLVMRSDKPEAKGFQDWVTKAVLPAIRKDGGYIMGEEKVVTGEMSEVVVTTCGKSANPQNEKAPKNQGFITCHKAWRRRRDSNPRCSF